MEFGEVESEQEIGVVVFRVCVPLPCAVDLGTVSVGDVLELLNRLESLDRQPEILKELETLGKLETLNKLNGLKALVELETFSKHDELKALG